MVAMLIKLIQDDAEEQFLETLEALNKRALGRGGVFCSFSRVPLEVDADAVLSFLKDVLHDQDGEVYFFHDGDVAILWRGRGKGVLDAIIAAFTRVYREKLESQDRSKLFYSFDARVHGENLRLLVRAKLKQKAQEQEAMASCIDEYQEDAIVGWKPEFTGRQLRALSEGKVRRLRRKAPEFLIVEDQDFSRKLLASIFENDYNCYTAANGEQAVAAYAQYVPDITFLDIELPDADGHMLASLIKKHDPESYIVMVTGNNYLKDVEAAKANKVNGFIVKPYNKMKIKSSVEAFMEAKKKW